MCSAATGAARSPASAAPRSRSTSTARPTRTRWRRSRAACGRRLTTEQAKLLGLEQRALSRLIGAAAIDTHARELHLALSEQGIAELDPQDPAFQGLDGAFSQRSFQSFLRQNGVSEGRFVNNRRKEEVREQLTDTLLGGLAAAAAARST